METIAAFRASFSSLAPNWEARFGPTRTDLRVGSRTLLSNAWIQQTSLVSHLKMGSGKVGYLSRKRTAITASIKPSETGSSEAPIAPLQLESPIGQFLSQILVSHPHLVPVAVEQQLEQLQTDREAEKDKEETFASGTELVLYRRIAEVKASERRKALEEILYTLVIQKFMDASVSLIPTITPSSLDTSGRVDIWSSQEERLHSPEAYEMIQNHLSLILGDWLGDPNLVAEISKLKVGHVYVASVMYGYFVKRVDQRFQLEKAMEILPQGIDNEEYNIKQVTGEEGRPSGCGDTESLRNAQPHPEVSSWSGTGIGVGFGGIKSSWLRTYVMSFDGETLKRYATIRSKEASSIIEKHTEALFGRPEMAITPEGTVDSSNGEVIKISLGDLRRLVLEAVTFGSFLWDAESYEDSSYHFIGN